MSPGKAKFIIQIVRRAHKIRNHLFIIFILSFHYFINFWTIWLYHVWSSLEAIIRGYEPKDLGASTLSFCYIYCPGFHWESPGGSVLPFDTVNMKYISWIQCCCIYWPYWQYHWFALLMSDWEYSNPQNSYCTVQQAIKQAYLNFQADFCLLGHLLLKHKTLHVIQGQLSLWSLPQDKRLTKSIIYTADFGRPTLFPSVTMTNPTN